MAPPNHPTLRHCEPSQTARQSMLCWAHSRSDLSASGLLPARFAGGRNDVARGGAGDRASIKSCGRNDAVRREAKREVGRTVVSLKTLRSKREACWPVAPPNHPTLRHCEPSQTARQSMLCWAHSRSDLSASGLLPARFARGRNDAARGRRMREAYRPVN